MALFDFYEPSRRFACPVCHAHQTEWQGYDGPCGLFVFREGVSGAIDQRVDDDWRLAPDQLAVKRLPDLFFIQARDCKCPFPTVLRCSASAGVWLRSELFTGSEEDRERRGPERREAWKIRLKWLESRSQP